MLSWFTVITLMVEAARVIEMRLRLIALGRGTADEMFLMVTEKVKALEEAGAIILRGGNPSLVIDEDCCGQRRTIVGCLERPVLNPLHRRTKKGGLKAAQGCESKNRECRSDG